MFEVLISIKTNEEKIDKICWLHHNGLLRRSYNGHIIKRNRKISAILPVSKKLNHKTTKAYRIDLTQFHLYSQRATDPLSRACIIEHIRSLHKLYKPKTVKRKIASLKAFINYLEFEEIITNNPLDKMRLEFKEPKSLPRALSLKTIKRLLAAVYHASSEAGTDYQEKLISRDVAVLELLFATGLRVSELCCIVSSDINLREGWVKVQGKGAKERIVFIANSEVLFALRKYKKIFHKEIESVDWFFINRLGSRLSEQSVRDIIQKYARNAKIFEHITPHMIHHSFATLMLEEDVDIRYIQNILGHSSITTTQIYTHVTAAKQRKIMSKKHPRNKVQI